MRQIRDFRSKKEFVYDTLRAAILEGELGPGSRLVIDEFSRKLGVSQIPVREALQQLQADGFVTIEPYVGARITEIDVRLVGEIFDLLESLEVISGRMACQQMTDKDLDEMGAFLRSMDALVNDPDSFSWENARLHQFICDRAGTPLVKSLMVKVLAHWDRLRHHYLNAVFVYRLSAAQREHWRILEALRTRDADHVERVIREHNRAARAAYEEQLRVGSAVLTTSEPCT